MTRGEPTDEVLVQDYVSKWYGKRYSGSGFLYHSRVVTQMLAGIKFREGRQSDKVLDVGCGTGFVSQLYPNFDIVGIDISDGMLKQNPYLWLKAPAEAIPFPENTFDFVVCRSLLHHLEDPRRGLTEMFRVLKPEGHWVCWEPNLSIFNDWIRKLAKLTRRFSHWHRNFSPQELIQFIEGAGFIITERRYHGHIAYPLLGFPDILDLDIPISIGRRLMVLDEWLSHTWLAPMGWAVMIRATKPMPR